MHTKSSAELIAFYNQMFPYLLDFNLIPAIKFSNIFNSQTRKNSPCPKTHNLSLPRQNVSEPRIKLSAAYIVKTPTCWNQHPTRRNPTTARQIPTTQRALNKLGCWNHACCPLKPARSRRMVGTTKTYATYTQNN